MVPSVAKMIRDLCSSRPFEHSEVPFFFGDRVRKVVTARTTRLKSTVIGGAKTNFLVDLMKKQQTRKDASEREIRKCEGLRRIAPRVS